MKPEEETNKMLLKDLVFFAVFLSIVLGISACQEKGPAEKAGQKIDQAIENADKKLEQTKQLVDDKAVKSSEYMDDAAITSKIKAEILSEPLLKVSQINVTTTDRVVKLNGEVDSQQAIDRVMQIAKSNRNVKSVENSLSIKPVK